MPKDVEPSAIGTTGVIIALAYFVIANSSALRPSCASGDNR
jgi:hypothetical protein